MKKFKLTELDENYPDFKNWDAETQSSAKLFELSLKGIGPLTSDLTHDQLKDTYRANNRKIADSWRQQPYAYLSDEPLNENSLPGSIQMPCLEAETNFNHHEQTCIELLDALNVCSIARTNYLGRSKKAG